MGGRDADNRPYYSFSAGDDGRCAADAPHPSKLRFDPAP